VLEEDGSWNDDGVSGLIPCCVLGVLDERMGKWKVCLSKR